MASRTTEWRHRTGRSKSVPKGPVDYRTIARLGVMKRFPALWHTFRDDCIQETELLALEAERCNRWYEGKKGGKVGYRRFVRWVWRHFNDVAKKYGFYRHHGTGPYRKREEEWNEAIEKCISGH
ncbi:MAG: hypothetical protein V2B18_21195 [Pseudomonadota bacterium]